MGKKASTSLGLVMLVAVFLVVGLTGTAFATQPANVGDPLNTSVPAVAEVQSMVVSANSMDYRLDYGAVATGPTALIDYSDDAATVQAKINATLIAPVSVATAAGGPGNAGGSNPYTLTFSLASGNIPLPTADTSTLINTLGPATVVVTTVVEGASGTGALDVSPHGGYSSSTDYCLQCHQVHDAENGYALLQAGVDNVCATCHDTWAVPAGGKTLLNNGAGPATADYGVNDPNGIDGIAGGPVDPGFEGGTIATTSQRAVWENGRPTNRAGEVWGHTTADMRTNNSTGYYLPNWDYVDWQQNLSSVTNSHLEQTAGDVSDEALRSASNPGPYTGKYCGSCHTPHGADYGLAVNTEKSQIWQSDPTNAMPADPCTDPSYYSGTRMNTAGKECVMNRMDAAYDKQSWAENSRIWWFNWTGGTAAGVAANAWGYLYLHAAPANPYGWQLCSAADGGGTCTDAAVKNAKNETVSLYAYQLLSASPNHTWSHRHSYKTDLANKDGATFCGTCHSTTISDELGGVVHAHPTGCDACHGNSALSISAPGPANGYPDFPHSVRHDDMLKQYPDGLCITCHTSMP